MLKQPLSNPYLSKTKKVAAIHLHVPSGSEHLKSKEIW